MEIEQKAKRLLVDVLHYMKSKEIVNDCDAISKLNVHSVFENLCEYLCDHSDHPSNNEAVLNWILNFFIKQGLNLNATKLNPLIISIAFSHVHLVELILKNPALDLKSNNIYSCSNALLNVIFQLAESRLVQSIDIVGVFRRIIHQVTVQVIEKFSKTIGLKNIVFDIETFRGLDVEIRHYGIDERALKKTREIWISLLDILLEHAYLDGTGMSVKSFTQASLPSIDFSSLTLRPETRVAIDKINSKRDQVVHAQTKLSTHLKQSLSECEININLVYIIQNFLII